MRNIIIAILVLVLLGVGGYFAWQTWGGGNEPEEVTQTPPVTEGDANGSETPAETEGETVIAQSVEDRDITAYHYGTGEREVLFVGGMHGGYSWNTALVAYELMDFLEANPRVVPENVTVTVVPVLNPDGLFKVVGKEGRFTKADVPTSVSERIPGRFNAHNVDLNRNFDCDWQRNAMWQEQAVSGGDAVFSEPESAGIRDYINESNPSAVIVWYSSAGGVFASNCHDGVLPQTAELTKVFAEGSGYQAYQSFDFYETTGDMTNWLAKEGVPAVSVLLTTHEDTEWTKNRGGVEAVLELVAAE